MNKSERNLQIMIISILMGICIFGIGVNAVPLTPEGGEGYTVGGQVEGGDLYYILNAGGTYELTDDLITTHEHGIQMGINVFSTIIIEGNNHSITSQQNAIFNGNCYGLDLTVNNLTSNQNIYIVSKQYSNGENGTGASITGKTGESQVSIVVTLNNCNVSTFDIQNRKAGNGGMGYISSNMKGNGGNGGNVNNNIFTFKNSQIENVKININNAGDGGTGGSQNYNGATGGYGGNGGSIQGEIQLNILKNTTINTVEIHYPTGGNGGNGGNEYGNTNQKGGPGGGAGSSGGQNSFTFYIHDSTVINAKVYFQNGPNGGAGGPGHPSSGTGGNGGRGGESSNGNFYITNSNIIDCNLFLQQTGIGGTGGSGSSKGQDGYSPALSYWNTIHFVINQKIGNFSIDRFPTNLHLNSPLLIYNNYITGIMNPAIPTNYVKMYTDPIEGKNIIGGDYIAGNYWSNENKTGFSDETSSRVSNLTGLNNNSYIDLSNSGNSFYNAVQSLGFTISSTGYNGDLYPLIDPSKIPVVTYNPPPALTLIDSGMSVESDALFTPTKKIQLSANESIVNQKFIANTKMIVITTHGIYNIDTQQNTVMNIGGTRGAITKSEIYSDYITTWDDSGDLTIWKTGEAEQAGTKLLMGFDQYLVQDVTNNNEYVAYSTLDSTSDTTPSVYSFKVDGTYQGAAANIAAYKYGTMQLSSSNVLAMIRSVTGNTNFPRYNPSNMAGFAAITVPAAPQDLQNIMNTDTFVIPSTGSTYMYGYNSAGTQTFSAISALTTPANHISGSDARNIVVSNNNVVYVIDSAGATIGQFATGAVVNGVGMARGSGLYFVAGGDDSVFYVFSKFQSSDWVLGQGTQMIDKISHVSMSPTGIFATCTVNGEMYIWVKSSFVPSPTPTGGGAAEIEYYLSIQVVDNYGIPILGDAVLIDYSKEGSPVSQTLYTDANGRVVIQVTPTTMYTITLANGYVYKYTASNLQLQSLSLVKSYEAYAPNIDYNVWYDPDTDTIYMYYEDKAKMTDNVTFTIYDAQGNQLWTQTQQGNNVNTSHSFSTVMRANMMPLRTMQLEADTSLRAEELGTTYQVNVLAVKDKSTDNNAVVVKNTWFVGTGGDILNFPVDQTWKNIFFTLLLMVICGVFGWVGSVKGAIGIAGVAVAFSYLGLIQIPLIWVWGIVFIAFLVVYGYSSQQEGS